MQKRPIVYIASPYTRGDQAINTHFQCNIFNKLMDDGRAWPIAPLWSHFQHTIFPRKYSDWIDYDKALLHCYDACVRLTATCEAAAYTQVESSGADGEVAAFHSMGKPVFHSIEELYSWIDGQD